MLTRLQSIQKYYVESGKIMKTDVKFLFDELNRLTVIENIHAKCLKTRAIATVNGEPVECGNKL